MSNVEYVRPDMLFSPTVNVEIDQPWQMLNPCPYCGAVPHDAPDGVHANGDPRWNFPHCFACGFRPLSMQADDLTRTRQEFAAFQQWQQSQSQQALPAANSTPQPQTQTPEPVATQPQDTQTLPSDAGRQQGWQPPEQAQQNTGQPFPWQAQPQTQPQAAADAAVQTQATDATTQQGS